MITKDNKLKAISKTQLHKQDTGSSQAQISVLTVRINEITKHLNINTNDKMARRGLIQLVSQRKKHLKYLEANDFESYKSVVLELKLRK